MKTRAMTIAEVLVTLTIFALVLLFLLPLIPMGLHSQQQATNRSLATTMALGELERLASLSKFPPVGRTSRQMQDFDIVADVLPVTGFPRELEINVRVSWKERGMSFSVVLVEQGCGARY